jgi:hypothetical protein
MKLIASVLVAALALNTTVAALESDTPSQLSQPLSANIAQAARVKAEVTKRGVGNQSYVRVRLHDGTELKGYISKVDDSSFELADLKSGKLTTISYEEVSKVKRQGLSKPVKILIVGGLVAGAMIVLGVAAACHAEGGPHC